MQSPSPDLPDDMYSFSILNSAPALLAPRLGRLALAGRKPMQTPGYIALTSRGALPHITPDMMRENMSVGGLYVGLEDLIERGPKETPPVFKASNQPFDSGLRKFLCQQDDVPLLLGPRRIPPVTSKLPHTSYSIMILTSVGFRQLNLDQYIESVAKLRPDMFIGLADFVNNPGVKRREKMVDRTHAWTRDTIERLYGGENNGGAPCSLLLAPVLPLDQEQQTLYLQDLEEEWNAHIGGFAVYDAEGLAMLPESMSNLVRISLAEPRLPQQILKEIALGVDVTTVPFVGLATDAGIALDFTFPGPAGEITSTPKPLGFDMWPASHAADTSPLVEGCQCYSCRNHHRAYIRHLLNAKEMLAWTLLQVHNHHTLDAFFAAVRESIQRGTFDEDVQKFEASYESEFPEQTGPGPRLRGYQFKTESHAPRANPKQYGRLNDLIALSSQTDSSAVTPDANADAGDLEASGFAEKAT